MKNFANKQLHFSNLQELPIHYSENEHNSPMRSSKFSNEDELISPDPIRVGFSNQIWRKNALRILYIVVKFITYILTNSEKFKFTFVNENQFKAINDKTAFYEFYVKNQFIRKAKIRTSFLVSL